MNKTLIAGHLGADPETRFTPSGQKVTTFRLATNYRKGDKEVTLWWRVTVWGDRFDKMMPYIKKGSAVIVMGELRPEIYMDRENRPQMSLDLTADTINFSPFGKPDKGGDQAGASSGQHPAQNQSFGEQTFGQASANSFKNAQPEEDPLPF